MNQNRLQYAICAMKAGAYGYIAKASASEELIEAIRKVSRGEKYFSSSIAENCFPISSRIRNNRCTNGFRTESTRSSA